MGQDARTGDNHPAAMKESTSSDMETQPLAEQLIQEFRRALRKPGWQERRIPPLRSAPAGSAMATAATGTCPAAR
ncbi:MAG: hypothetical protein ACLFSI_08550 [Halorhodospira sp.]